MEVVLSHVKYLTDVLLKTKKFLKMYILDVGEFMLIIR